MRRVVNFFQLREISEDKPMKNGRYDYENGLPTDPKKR